MLHFLGQRPRPRPHEVGESVKLELGGVVVDPKARRLTIIWRSCVHAVGHGITAPYRGRVKTRLGLQERMDFLGSVATELEITK